MENLKKTTKVKKVEKVYSYFVSYAWKSRTDRGNGFGSKLINKTEKIKNGEDVGMVVKYIQDLTDFDIIILNFILFEE